MCSTYWSDYFRDLETQDVYVVQVEYDEDGNQGDVHGIAGPFDAAFVGGHAPEDVPVDTAPDRAEWAKTRRWELVYV